MFVKHYHYVCSHPGCAASVRVKTTLDWQTPFLNMLQSELNVVKRKTEKVQKNISLCSSVIPSIDTSPCQINVGGCKRNASYHKLSSGSVVCYNLLPFEHPKKLCQLADTVFRRRPVWVEGGYHIPVLGVCTDAVRPIAMTLTWLWQLESVSYHHGWEWASDKTGQWW